VVVREHKGRVHVIGWHGEISDSIIARVEAVKGA
jgi:hypothetical protein